MKQPFGIILAGGQGTRIGGVDKAFLELGGITLMHHCIARLRPQVADWAINANGTSGRFSTFSVPVLPDPIAGHLGPLAGVLAGLDWAAKQGGEHVVTVAVDTPFFPEVLVPRLLLASETAGLAVAATPSQDQCSVKSGGSPGLDRHPTFGLWPVALRDDLRQWLLDGERKMALWLDRHGAGEAVFPDRRSFFNINTAKDLAEAQAIWAKKTG